MNRFGIGLALILAGHLASACAQPDAGDEVDSLAETGPGTSDASGDGDGDASGDGDGEASGDGDGEPGYGHGNLHPDCLGDAPLVVLETSLGTIVLQLDAVRAPLTVANFLGYVSSGFYDGTIFHRVINNFVVQGGGFEPGLILKPTVGPIPLEIDPALTHVDGALAMARNQEPDTAEAQWYITDGAQPNLDGNYAVFGAIIDGFPVRNAISSVETGTAEWEGFTLENVPVEDVLLDAAYCVTAWP